MGRSLHFLHMKRDVFSGIPGCFHGISVRDAYRNGYRHGYEDLNTRGICTLTIDTPEHQAWQDGYTAGERDHAANAPANPEPPCKKAGADKTSYCRALGYSGRRNVIVLDGQVTSHRGANWFDFCAAIERSQIASPVK